MASTRKTEKSQKESGQRRLSTLLALDFATTGIKAVRLKKNKDQLVLTAADILPPIGLDAEDLPDLPKPLSSYYTALCSTMENASLRVFQQAMAEGDDIETVARENLTVEDDSRVNGRILERARGRRESTLLGVSVPERTVQYYLRLFESGAPAPHSLEVSALAALSGFIYTCGDRTANQTVCVIDAGARFTTAAFFHRNQLQLVNRFDAGSEAIVRQVQRTLGIDADMAGTILVDGSVDISVDVRKVIGSAAKQLAIYREFIERQNKSSLSAVYLSGGLTTAASWCSALKTVFGFIPEVWNPFEKIECLADALPEQFKGQEPRFAAAVGAAIAGLEGS
jgi:hypothetical protein